MKLLKQLNSLFNRRERWQLAILSVALVIRAAVEMVGVASIMPFMSVVAEPEFIQTNPYLNWAYESFGFSSETGFITALGVAVIVFLILANGFRALAVWGMTRFSWGMHHKLAMRLLKGYLSMPYSFFTERNSASFNKTLLNELQEVIRGVLEPLLDVEAKVLVIGAIVGLLVVMDPLLALVVVVVVGGSYGILYTAVKKKQRQLGKVRVAANHERFKVTGEAFGGIKDVKVLQREEAFVERFLPASWRYSHAMASSLLIAKVPRYFFEIVAFGGIVLIVLYYLRAGQGTAQILPVLSLYAFAGYRLMPELQQLFHAATQIRFNRAALDDLTTDLNTVGSASIIKKPERKRPFEHAIEVENVTFTYSGAEKPALDGITLCIERNQTVGLVGASGSGKTTLVDLLLGLYQPESGRILIDGVPLDENTINAWRSQVGYVPQHIFLTDDTIAANIAFGVPFERIDFASVEKAARIAHLHDFIQTLPNGYNTVVGERGVRLSGGQRQRIGIARAIYHDPTVLVMDEATSALDGATESAVMEAIHALAGKKTIILIAHRLTTVQEADVIWILRDGKVEQSGAFDLLMRENESFRAFAGVSNQPGL